jgi:hypothetical protein
MTAAQAKFFVRMITGRSRQEHLRLHLHREIAGDAAHAGSRTS